MKKRIRFEQQLQNAGMLLRNFRISSGLTQKQLSNIAGVHYNSIHAIERGLNQGFNIKTLLCCMYAMGYGLSDFFEDFESD